MQAPGGWVRGQGTLRVFYSRFPPLPLQKKIKAKSLVFPWEPPCSEQRGRAPQQHLQLPLFLQRVSEQLTPVTSPAEPTAPGFGPLPPETWPKWTGRVAGDRAGAHAALCPGPNPLGGTWPTPWPFLWTCRFAAEPAPGPLLQETQFPQACRAQLGLLLPSARKEGSTQGPLPRPTSDLPPLSPGAAGTVKNLRCSPGWEVPSSWPVLPGCARACCVTHGWALALSGLGLLSGHGCRRLCPRLTWQTARSGAMCLDRCLALGRGRGAPGAAGAGSPQRVCQESLAYHWPMRFWASPCPRRAVRAGGRTFPCSTLARAPPAASKNPRLLDPTEKGSPWPPGGSHLRLSGSLQSPCVENTALQLGLRARGRCSVPLATRSWHPSSGTGSA